MKNRNSFIFQRSNWNRTFFYVPELPLDDTIRFVSETESHLHNLLRYMNTTEEYFEQNIINKECTNSIQFVCNLSELLQNSGVAKYIQI